MATINDAAALRRAISTRITNRVGAGLLESGLPLGVSVEGASRLNRAFRVVMEDEVDQGERVGGGVNATLRILQRFDIELGHEGNPELGPTIWDQALEDQSAVQDALLRHVAGDDLATVQNTIEYLGMVKPTTPAGGMLRLALLRFTVHYTHLLGGAA